MHQYSLYIYYMHNIPQIDVALEMHQIDNYIVNMTKQTKKE